MMSQHIPCLKWVRVLVSTPRKRSVVPVCFFFSFLFFFLPRCSYAESQYIKTALEEGLLQLRCTYQPYTTQGALQVMLPLLHELGVRRLTLEGGLVKGSGPLQVTAGTSFRQAFTAAGFWGVNGILDVSSKKSGTQLSVGVEGYLSPFFMALSGYFPLSTIQEKEAAQTDKKRLAKSIEARFFYTFPSVEAVQAGIVVEQLMGDAIELPGTEEKQKSPLRGLLQVEYQPISLVKAHLGYQLQTGSSRCHQVVAGIGLTVRFNQLLAEQTQRSMQKKVLLTGDGAYELIARRYDRPIDHGRMPNASVPAAVSTTLESKETVVQSSELIVPEATIVQNPEPVVPVKEATAQSPVPTAHVKETIVQSSEPVVHVKDTIVQNPEPIALVGDTEQSGAEGLGSPLPSRPPEEVHGPHASLPSDVNASASGWKVEEKGRQADGMNASDTSPPITGNIYQMKSPVTVESVSNGSCLTCSTWVIGKMPATMEEMKANREKTQKDVLKAVESGETNQRLFNELDAKSR